jgi:cysteinyl-tRNA synthetase
MVTVDGQKMGKSLNNFITLKQVFTDSPEPKHEKLSRKYDPLAVRQLILISNYRSPLDFSDAALFAAQSGHDSITKTTEISDALEKARRNQESVTETAVKVRQKWNVAPEGPCDERITEQLKEFTREFEEAMNNDLNTSVALSVIFKLVELTNKLLEDNNTTKETLNRVDERFRRLGGDVLGIVKQHYGRVKVVIDYKMTNELVRNLIEQRNTARRQKDFAAADTIRDKLLQIGVVLEDTPGETVWRFK